MLSSHLFFCLPLRLPPLTVPCKIVFARSDDLYKDKNKFGYVKITIATRFTLMTYPVILRCAVSNKHFSFQSSLVSSMNRTSIHTQLRSICVHLLQIVHYLRRNKYLRTSYLSFENTRPKCIYILTCPGHILL